MPAFPPGGVGDAVVAWWRWAAGESASSALKIRVVSRGSLATPEWHGGTAVFSWALGGGFDYKGVSGENRSKVFVIDESVRISG